MFFSFLRWSVRAQLLLLVGTVLFPALAALALFVVHERQISLQHAYERVGLVARTSAADLSRMLHDHERLLSRLAQRPMVRALDATRCDPLVAEYTQLHSDYTNLVVRDLADQNDCSALPRKIGAGQSLAALVPGYAEAKGREGLTVGAPHKGPLSGRWVAVLFYPVKDAHGKPAGLISLPINLAALAERHLGDAAPHDVVLVVDKGGQVLMRSRGAEAWDGKLVPAPLLAGPSVGENGQLTATGADGVTRFFAAASVRGADWRVVAGVPADQVLAVPNQAAAVGVLLVLLSLVTALLLAWRIGRGLVRPIDTLSRVSGQVAAGETAVRVPQSTGPKELAAVSTAFNHMLDAREQAQRALSDSEQRFRTLTALSSDWYWEIDVDYRFTRIDGQHGSRSGPPIRDYVGKARWDFPAPNLSQEDWDRHRAVLAAHEPFRDFEVQRFDDYGKLHWVTVSGTPMFDAAGRFCGYRGVGADITERKLHEHRRLRMSHRIEELSRRLVLAQEETRRKFAAELHDRTSPNLAALRINLDIIAQATPEARLGPKFALRIEDTRALIDDTTASIRDVCADLHPQALEVGGLLAAVTSYTQQFSVRTGLRTKVDCQHGEVRLAPQIEFSLFRIVQEAMTNVAKHARAKVVVVRLMLGPGPVHVSVTDDGAGFEVDHMLQLSSRCGLGLRTMRETAEFIGGRLAVQSAPGAGAQVMVDIEG